MSKSKTIRPSKDSYPRKGRAQRDDEMQDAKFIERNGNETSDRRSSHEVED